MEMRELFQWRVKPQFTETPWREPSETLVNLKYQYMMSFVSVEPSRMALPGLTDAGWRYCQADYNKAFAWLLSADWKRLYHLSSKLKHLKHHRGRTVKQARRIFKRNARTLGVLREYFNRYPQ